MDSDDGFYGLYVVTEAHGCHGSLATSADWVGGVSLGGPMHGARIWVPQGYLLCAEFNVVGTSIAASIGWAGFVPY